MLGMVSRLDVSEAVLPELDDALVERVARFSYREYVGVCKDVGFEGVGMSWGKLDEGVRIAWRAAARVAWQQIAIGGGARIVRSKD